MMRRTLGTVALVVALLSVAIPAPAENKSLHAKILDGSRVSELQYPFVARLTYGGELLCTGTLIGSRYVLTAAHCFFDSRNRRAVGDTEIVARLNGQQYASARVSIHPTYRSRSSACVDGELDAAIIELANEVPGVLAIPLLESSTPVGSTVTLVGYGTEGSGNTGENGSIPPIGLVNTGTTIVQGYGDSPPQTNPTSTYYFWKFDVGEANTGSGDSGGPAFFYSGDQTYLSGITCGGEGRSEFGTYSYNTRSDVLVTWARAITVSAPTGTAPAFTSLSTQGVTVGNPFSLTVPVSGTAPIDMSAMGLPPGLVLVDSLISGSPTATGIYTVTLTANNANGSATTAFSIVVASFMATLKVSAAELVFDNDPSSDYLAIAGRIGIGPRFKPDKARVVVRIGRYSRAFRLNRKGQSASSSSSYFDLKGKLKSGRYTKPTIAFELEVDKAALFDELSTLGFPDTDFATDGQRVALPISVSINGIESSVTENLAFDGRDSIWELAR